MVYRHRMQNGKVRHFQSRAHYERSVKAMFANQYQKKNHSKKIAKSKRRIKHRGIGKVSSTRKQVCNKCKREKTLDKGMCKECTEAFASYKQPKSKKTILNHLEKETINEYWRNFVSRNLDPLENHLDHRFPSDDNMLAVIISKEDGYVSYWDFGTDIAPPDTPMEHFWIVEIPVDFETTIEQLLRIDLANIIIREATNRMEHDVDIKAGKEFCAMCKRKGQILTKGKCKVCRQAEKAFEGERKKAERKQKESSQDAYIIDRVTGGWGDLIKGKEGKWGTRVILFKQHAYSPIAESYRVLRTNPVSYGGQVSFPPYNDDRKEFSIHVYAVLGKDAREEAEKYYNSLR